MYYDYRIKNGVADEELNIAKTEANSILPKGKDYYAQIFSITQGFRMLSFIMKGNKSNPEIKKSGYYLAYVYNLDAPELSEFGEVYLEYNKEKGILRRL